MNEPTPCPQEDLLVANLDEPFSPEVSDHIQTCDSCRQRVERMRSLAATLGKFVEETTTFTSPVPAPSPELPVPGTERPALMGNYLIVGDLGSGGQGRVFRGMHRELHRDVAIKWCNRPIASPALSELVREGKLLASLDHPGIVRIFDLNTHEGKPYLVMEYVRGSNLHEFAKREKIAPAQAAGLVAQLARVLAHAHSRGIIHQDIKPSNILMDEQGCARLADFGLAQWRDLWNQQERQPSGGTLAYMAPEQFSRPEAAGPSSDVFALGGVLFFLLTGQPPRRLPANPALALDKAQTAAVDFQPLIDKKLPRKLVDICQKALAFDPGQRYPRALDLAADLERFLHRPLWPYALAAGLAFLLVVYGVYSFFVSSPHQAVAGSLNLGVVRGNKEISLLNDKDLERLLPLVEGDKLRIGGTIPSGMKFGIFAVTLTDSKPRVQKLGPLESRDDQFRVTKPFLLQDSPGTELVILCAGTDQAPDLADVAPLLDGLFPSRKAKGACQLSRPVHFDRDKVSDPRWQRGRLVPVEDDPEDRILADLEGVRQKLAGKFPVVAGIAFTHVAPEEAKAKRAARDTGPLEPGREDWGGSEEEKKLFQEVMDKLLATDLVRKAYPAELSWPPRVRILPGTAKEFNAYARQGGRAGRGEKFFAEAVITEGYMKKIVRGQPEILAAIMGHELVHLLKRHPGYRKELVAVAISREQEIEADLEGVKIAIAANYPYDSGIKAGLRELKAFGDYPHFPGLKVTHPSWTERLELLDTKRALFWKAMGAFKNGYFFLHVEQYPAAEDCFAGVVKEFPEYAEGWANLGYARLMQYCDGLEVQDLRKYGIGQFAAGCFYARPEGWIAVRGTDEKLWRRAVDALEKALKTNDNLVLARANLGLAYLVHPDGKKPARAVDYFRQALQHKDKGLDRLNLAALLVNYGVAELALGKSKEAADKFGQAKIILPAPLAPIMDQLDLAIVYNQALVASATKETEKKAFFDLEFYLTRAGTASAWWTLAHERYQELARDLKMEPLAKAELAKRFGAKLMRPVTSVTIAPAKLLTLGDPAPEALKLLAAERSLGLPLFRNSKVKRYYQAAPGIDLLADRKVIAVFLVNDKAPPVYVQPQGQGAKKQALKVGMTAREFFDVVKGQFIEERFIDNPDITYRFLPNLGLGVRFADGRVSEIVLAQVPRRF